MDSINEKDDFQINLYNHSGNHYRHLENQRNEYVKFYFTFIAATIALIQFLPKSENSFSVTLGIVAILLINLILGTLIYAAIKKIGFALNMHYNVLEWMGLNYLTKNKYDEILGINEKFKKILDSRLLNTQLSMEYSIIFILFILDITIASITACKICKETIFIVLLIWIVVAALITLQIILLVKKNDSAK